MSGCYRYLDHVSLCPRIPQPADRYPVYSTWISPPMLSNRTPQPVQRPWPATPAALVELVAPEIGPW